MNVGGGSGAAPASAPASAPAAGGDSSAAAAPKAEEKEEGTFAPHTVPLRFGYERITDMLRSQGGVRRGHGLRSFRLSVSLLAYRQGQWQSIDGAQGSVCGYFLDGYASTSECKPNSCHPEFTLLNSRDPHYSPRSDVFSSQRISLQHTLHGILRR